MAGLGPELIPVLAQVVKEYISLEDLVVFCGLFDESPELSGTGIDYTALARRLILKIEHGNNRRLLELIVDTAKIRCMERVAKSSFERQAYHQEMLSRIGTIEAGLGDPSVPQELSIPEAHPFTAKSELRALLSTAETEVMVVDNYVGPAALDCLIEVPHPIRLLTGAHSQAIAAGFEPALKDFRGEGRLITVRRHRKLHDRHVVFNGRCWLLGSSIKDAGKKAFTMIECIDSKRAIINDIEQKWAEGQEFTP